MDTILLHVFIPRLLVQLWDVPELSVNYPPAAVGMTLLIKDLAANIHLYSFLSELPSTLWQSTCQGPVCRIVKYDFHC